MSPVPTQISSAPPIPNHPVTTGGQRGAALFVLWCLIQLAGVAAMAWSIASVMRGIDHDTLDDTAIALGAAVFLGVFVAVRMVSRRVLHLAWGEVPGAFGWRSAARAVACRTGYEGTGESFGVVEVAGGGESGGERG